ncbi:MAG: DciA family protein [Pseudomonadota bacterium]
MAEAPLKPPKKAPRRKRGFERAAGLLSAPIRKAGESRGFAVSRVLTHWEEIAGADLASIARPVNVSYARGGFGATLTVLTTGAQAPMLEMQKETLRERVNAAYGYAAIKRIYITQTAPVGFQDGAVLFDHAPREKTDANADIAVAEARRVAAQSAAGVANADLRQALSALGANVLSRKRET